MARLILKSPYIKGGARAVSYAKYIGTRERVELVPDGRPATKKQEQLIASLVKDFLDAEKLPEYSDYHHSPTKVNASVFITQALEDNWDSVQQSDIYAEYIATRPRVERFSSHGLFGDEDYVDLKNVTAELECCGKNVWTHIVSLKREDAVRLGYDNARSWRNLLRAHRNDIAAAMNIPPSDFRWYAAFHDEEDHPHVHMMAWSAGAAPGYLSPVGIQKIKSKLTNDIFRQEMLHVYEQKSQSRDELVAEAHRAMLELADEMKRGVCEHPEAEQLMLALSSELKDVKGKKQCGYFPKREKKLVDEIVDQMAQLPSVQMCYDKWLELQQGVNEFYSDKPMERTPLSQQKEFRAIHNAVVQAAVQLGQLTFEDKGLENSDEPDDALWASTTYRQLWTVMAVIQKDPLWHGFFYTELTTGLRRGEICGLMWSDFDERSGTLKVSRTLHREKGGRLVAGDTKTYAGTRKIILPPSTAELLRARKKKSFSPWIFHDPLRPEAPISPDSAYRQLKSFLADAGLPDIRFHDLRHTFSTHALASGVDAKTLSGILGHTKASFTLDTYTHTTGDMQKRAADIVGGFLTDYLGEEMKPWQSAENAVKVE